MFWNIIFPPYMSQYTAEGAAAKGGLVYAAIRCPPRGGDYRSAFLMLHVLPPYGLIKGSACIGK